MAIMHTKLLPLWGILSLLSPAFSCNSTFYKDGEEKLLTRLQSVNFPNTVSALEPEERIKLSHQFERFIDLYPENGYLNGHLRLNYGVLLSRRRLPVEALDMVAQGLLQTIYELEKDHISLFFCLLSVYIGKDHKYRKSFDLINVFLNINPAYFYDTYLFEMLSIS